MLGILTAMPEEIEALLPFIAAPTVTSTAGRRFVAGDLFGVHCVAACSRWGKTAAASTATELIVRFGVSRIAFFGIAGGIDPAVRIGDIVVARTLTHHDLDASPFYPPTVVPLLGISALPTDGPMTTALLEASKAFLSSRAADLWATQTGRTDWHRSPRRACWGDIASGDQVVTTLAQKDRVRTQVPGALAVEMEGAAVAQVCYEHGVPYACVRTISDNADHSAPDDVKPFFHGLAGEFTAGVAREWLRDGRSARQ